MILWSLGARTRTRPTCPARCAHCGLPAPAPCFREGREMGPAFCCRACRQIYELVLELVPKQSEVKERPPARAE